MPIPQGTILAEMTALLADKIAAYNAGRRTSRYNIAYRGYVDARANGIGETGSLGDWIAGGGAAEAILALLISFGMNAHNSELVKLAALQRTLTSIDVDVVNWIACISLPLFAPPPVLVNPATGETLSGEVRQIYEFLAKGGSVTVSGGCVAASKTMHLLFPDLAPMIDGTHSGISYYNIARATYAPPLGLADWTAWIGEPIAGVANPSPRGAGRNAWQWAQFVAAVGVNQHIYETWQAANGNPGFEAFLAIDPTPGTTGVPRIIDKVLW